MTNDLDAFSFDTIDLKEVAEILNDVYPSYSLCDCARMAANVVPENCSICSLCAPGTFPGCVKRKRRDARTGR